MVDPAESLDVDVEFRIMLLTVGEPVGIEIVPVVRGRVLVGDEQIPCENRDLVEAIPAADLLAVQK